MEWQHGAVATQQHVTIMKKLLFFLALLAPMAAMAQIPALTNASQIKFQDGNNTFLKRLDSLVAFVNAGSGTVTSVNVSGGTTGLSTTGGPVTTAGTITLAGTLVAANGGTGQSSYTTGDILYASGATALSKLAGVATGNALISGGVSTAPSWGKIGLTTHVSGTLPVGNGGTGVTAIGGDGTVLASNGTANVYLSPTVTTDDAPIAFERDGSNLNLNIPDATGANRGTVSTVGQTFAGAKNFAGLVTGSAGVSAFATASAAAFNATGVEASSWTTENANTTIDHTDNFLEIGTLTGGITITLPACNATTNKWTYEFLKTGSDTFGVTIDPAGSETFFDSAATKTIYSQGNGATCKCKWNGTLGTWFYSTQM